MRRAVQNLLAAAFCVAAFSVSAACLPTQNTVLSCTAKSGSRVLDVCIEGAQISYAYGRRGAPAELRLAEPVATIAHQPWNGIGRSIWEATTFMNAGFAYEVFISVDRMAEGQPITAGVAVMQGARDVARVDCDPGSAEIGLWAVSDAKQALGICWDLSRFAWAPCG